ncbi:hypothetical protein D3C72_1591760 [compost metagenome]
MPERGAQALHGRRLADQRQIILRLPRRPAKGAVFQHQPALFQSPARAFHHALGRKWLGDKIISAVVKRIDGHRHIAMPCDEDDRQIGIDLADMVEKLKPGHARHTHIGDDDAVEILVQGRKRLFCARKRSNRQSIEFQRLHHRLAQLGVVVHQEYGSVHRHVMLASEIRKNEYPPRCFPSRYARHNPKQYRWR